MHTENISYYTTAVLHEYTKILSTYFPGVRTADDFINCFNKVFTGGYQGIKKEKMSPFSIQESRRISCSIAAGLCGLWWLLEKNHEPCYLIKPLGEQAKTKAHVAVRLSQGFRTQENLTPPMYVDLWSNETEIIGDNQRQKQFYLRQTPNEVVELMSADVNREQFAWHPRNRKAHSTTKVIPLTSSFIAERISLFDLNSDTRSKLDMSRSESQYYIKRYPELIAHLRCIYKGK